LEERFDKIELSTVEIGIIMKTNVAIIGVGLIGGSLGMALKKRHPGKYRVIGVGRHVAKLALAKRRGAIDVAYTDLGKGVCDADIIVICSPVDTIGDIAGKIAPFIKKGAVITDVGSVKERVVKEVSAVLPANLWRNFVGAHPMAGAEKSGIKAADAELFCGSTVVIDPTNSVAALLVAKLWIDAGAGPLWLRPAVHDALVAVTSHLPHLLAYSLCELAAARGKNGSAAKILSGSFKDLTRVADSDPSAWAVICSANAKEVSRAIDGMTVALKKCKLSLASRSALSKLLNSGHQCRQLLLKGSRE